MNVSLPTPGASGRICVALATPLAGSDESSFSLGGFAFLRALRVRRTTDQTLFLSNFSSLPAAPACGRLAEEVCS
jgi:hypothetical protein